MNGGGPANTLVRSLDSGWGRALFSNILIRNVAQSLYKVRPKFDLNTVYLVTSTAAQPVLMATRGRSHRN
jgi:hypothetical protein